VNSADHCSAWWLRSLPTLLAELGVTDSGLTHAEARARLKRYGLNQFRDRPERSLLVQFLRRFRNPLVLILIAASVVSAFTGEVASFVIIIVMVLLSVTLDFVQEYRAGRAAQRLRQSVQLRASVLRDGVAKDVPVPQVVPGDVVLLALRTVDFFAIHMIERNRNFRQIVEHACGAAASVHGTRALLWL